MFSRNRLEGDGRNEWCKKCYSEYSKLRYAQLKAEGRCTQCGKILVDTSKILCPSCAKRQGCLTKTFIKKTGYKRNPKTQNNQRVKKKERLAKKLGGCCFKCGYKGIALVFHHLTLKKDSGSWSKSKELENLIEKGWIMLLCANCHRELHHGFHYWHSWLFE